MTGFAADVSTTTTYNTEDGKIAVTTNVTGATADSEVTYLVKNSAGDIVYIDQDTAANGAVSFEYKIAQNKIADYATVVKFGTDANDAFAGSGTQDLGFAALKAQSGENYTVTYANDVVAAGIGETVTANIAANEGYELVDVKVNGESKGAVASVVVDNDDVITVEVAEAEKEPSIVEHAELADGVYTVVVIPTNVSEFGVEYAGAYYPSLEEDKTKTAAIQLILPEGTEAVAEDFVVYFE
jgi:hypothetical protein